MTNAFEPAYVPTVEDVEATHAAEQQLDRDPFERIRPIVTAIHMTVKELAPMFPMALLSKGITEGEVFKFLECLERHGYTITKLADD